mgnify:CR=1 FL=1
MTRYLVVERFRHGPAPVYARVAQQGRLIPAGLTFVESWVDESLERCFQLMEAEDPALFEVWTAAWADLVEFEIIRVLSSAEAAARAGRE